MTDNRAVEIITLRDKELADQAQFRDLWQDTRTYVFPAAPQITSTELPGADKSVTIYDPTAIQDSLDMASGMSSAIIPTGREFFSLRGRSKRIGDGSLRYLSELTDLIHEELFESNWMLQWNEALRSVGVFGTCNLYTEWDYARGKLNFKDYPIGSYQIQEDNHGTVDTVIITLVFTARQAAQEFGRKNLSEKILKALDGKPAERIKSFDFIHYVGPRRDRNPRLRDNRNMPFESIFVDVAGKKIVEESGFEQFPFAVARWMKGSGEKYGRGQGTENLSAVKVLQAIMRDYVETCNLHNNPPLVVTEGFEGAIRTSPGAVNYVMDKGTISAIDRGALGNPPVTKDMLEVQREIVHRAFYRDIFGQLASLTGDRRTTTEIVERVKESLRRLSQPVARLESELLTPTIARVVWLLIKHGRAAPPPDDLGGAFGIEYIGELGLALRNHRSKGFISWVSVVAQLSEVAPEALDLVNMDEGLRDLAESSGVDTKNVATPEEVAAKREQRAQQQQAAALAEAAPAAAGAYKDASGAPEEGSPAGALMGAGK